MYRRCTYYLQTETIKNFINPDPYASSNWTNLQHTSQHTATLASLTQLSAQ